MNSWINLLILLCTTTAFHGMSQGETADQKCERLINELKSPSASQRSTAIMQLLNLGDKAQKAGPHLAKLLQEERDLQVRILCATALGELKEKSAVEPLIAALNVEPAIFEGPPGIEGAVSRGTALRLMRPLVANALGAIKDHRAVEPLLKVLEEDKNPNVIQAVLWALGNIDAPKGLKALKKITEFVNHSNSGIAEAAQTALKKATKQEFGGDKAKWLKWLAENVKEEPDKHPK